MCHRFRRLFFRDASKRNDDGKGIAEESVNVRFGEEAIEAIEVAKLGVDWHGVIVTDFAKAEKTKTA